MTNTALANVKFDRDLHDGIYGLTIAYDAAQRGLSVALIERGDFGSGAGVSSSVSNPPGSRPSSRLSA